MNKRPSYVCGVCSLLVIFALICLTVFALVSLNTAKAGERLSRHQAEAISDYYDADLFAHSILAGRELEGKAFVIANQTLKEALHNVSMEDLKIAQEVLRKIFMNTKD